MDRAIERGPFHAHVTLRDGIIIQREDGSIRMSAGEADQVLSLMILVMGVESYPLLPSRLTTSPFECWFNTQRQIELRRVGQNPETQGVIFTFPEGDDLIGLIKQAVAKFIDKTTIKGARPKSVTFSTPDIPVEGR